MKIQALQNFRTKLSKGETLYGLWVTLESASITDIAVALDLDWVVIDVEHGHLDWKDINEHIRAGLRSSTVILVRIQERSTSLSKRVLDMGADGVVIPGVDNHRQLQEAVQDCHYPPSGRRGIGGERATVWGQCLEEHADEANTNVLVIPLIERVSAIPHIEEMCQVEGVDTFFIGPADFSASAGFPGQWEGPGIAEQIINIKNIIVDHNKYCGVMSTSNDNLLIRKEQGFRMLGIGSDSGMLLRSIRGILKTVDRDKKPKTSLDPRD